MSMVVRRCLWSFLLLFIHGVALAADEAWSYAATFHVAIDAGGHAKVLEAGPRTPGGVVAWTTAQIERWTFEPAKRDGVPAAAYTWLLLRYDVRRDGAAYAYEVSEVSIGPGFATTSLPEYPGNAVRKDCVGTMKLKVAIDADGNPTTDAAKAATLMPLGGPKGSGLWLLFECLSGVLAGTPIITTIAGLTGSKAPLQNALVIVFNIDNFRPLADYRRDVGLLTQFVKGLPRQHGFDELLLPGERGGRQAALRRKNGIPLASKLWSNLQRIAQPLGVPQPKLLS